MSRSYKKIPCSKDGGKWKKQWANSIVRNIPIDQTPKNGMQYKNVVERWEICDWKICESFAYRKCRQEQINKAIANDCYGRFEMNKYKDASSKEFYRKWYKMFKMK